MCRAQLQKASGDLAPPSHTGRKVVGRQLSTSMEERNVYTAHKSDCMVFNASWVQMTFKSHRPFMPAGDVTVESLGCDGRESLALSSLSEFFFTLLMNQVRHLWGY